jgi:hypothetical protein
LPTAQVPDEPLVFIRNCLSVGRVRWTYHLTMRVQQRKLSGEMLMKAVATLEIVEAYPHDKYLDSPSV